MDNTKEFIPEWSIKQLDSYVGGLSKPSKMPGYGYSLPAAECNVGGKLQKVENSVCNKCYAMRGNYLWPGTQKAMYRRLEAINRPHFVAVMAELLNRRAEKHPHFRWHDSGDLQSLEHLENIVAVAKLTPTVSHWIPTREYGVLLKFFKKHGRDAIPKNLTIRPSAHMVGGKVANVGGLPHSTVSKDESVYPDAYHCPSRFQNNECGTCRACWDSSVPHIDYHKH